MALGAWREVSPPAGPPEGTSVRSVRGNRPPLTNTAAVRPSGSCVPPGRVAVSMVPSPRGVRTGAAPPGAAGSARLVRRALALSSCCGRA
jgi:hypothetical protein